MKNQTLCKFILMIASISGCEGSSTDHRWSYHNYNSTVCVDTTAYIRYDSYGGEATFSCHPGAVTSVMESDRPGASRSAGYIVICNCRDAPSEKDMIDSQAEKDIRESESEYN
jgi:hypothetical protein